MEYVDTADDCAICLCPLADQETIKLGCGHLWHLECIKQQLKQASPNPGKRLLFSGCRCAKCGVFCESSALKSVTRLTSELRAAVDALIVEQLEVDGITENPDAHAGTSAFQGDLLAYGRMVYAFYQCGVCSRPYFGGTVACADADDELLPVAARVCPSCTPASSAACAHPTHVGFHEWKCRYCCNVASFVCYGTTHLCESCHKRNDAHIRTGADHSTLPPILCPGRPACELSMRTTQDRHENGVSHNCEQVLRCTLCSSDPLGVGLRESEANTSPNMLYNGDASHGTEGWTKHPYNDRWRIELSDVRFRADEHNFVSSYTWASMSQAVDLHRFLLRPEHARLQVSARFMARTDCPSIFVLKAALYDSNFEELESMTSEELSAPADFWEPVSHVFEPRERARFVLVGVSGKDSKGWAGEYGSKVTDVAVRVLFNGSTASDTVIMAPGVSSPTAPFTSSQTTQIVREFHLPTRRRAGMFW